jgi:molybdopterin-guanine dinucleotide biosynthesis protein A
MMPAAARDTNRVAAAILAGGLARRMAGANKGVLRVGEQRILDRQVAMLREVADPVFIVSSRPDTCGAVTGEILTIIPDALPGTGPLGGIYTAITSSPRTRTLIVACDMPFLTLPPRSPRGYEPLCATWSAACAEPIRRRIERGELKAALVVEELRIEELGPEVLAACDPHGLLFMNVNTPHDYQRAQELSRAAREDE